MHKLHCSPLTLQQQSQIVYIFKEIVNKKHDDLTEDTRQQQKVHPSRLSFSRTFNWWPPGTPGTPGPSSKEKLYNCLRQWHGKYHWDDSDSVLDNGSTTYEAIINQGPWKTHSMDSKTSTVC